MLATFVIGLREGLEAALIVGILATFLRRNGASLRPMWIGVLAAMLLSLLVGITLEVVSASLPQRAQEGMESIISAVAVVFVTSMIVWMSSHARGLKKDLEAHAASALNSGTVWAIAGMAFLAVLREGFETAVFLLATFQASSSVFAAVLGAVLGITAAVILGVGIYHGGVRINLARFFTITGIFLVFVAAGLVVSTLRTAHEAGWLTVGQGRTMDLAWLAPHGSVRAALVTGVLGIPADPRVVEVLAWLAYVVPMLALVLWPAARRPAGAALSKLQFGLAVACGLVASALLFVPAPGVTPQGPAPVVSLDSATASAAADWSAQAALEGTGSSAELVLTPSTGAATRTPLATQSWATDTRGGLESTTAQWTDTTAATDLPTQVTLADLLRYEGGRLPVGVSAGEHPGPFDASWQESAQTQVWLVDDQLLDARHDTRLVLTLSGGGLTSPRTVTVDPTAVGGTPSWQVQPDHVTAVADQVADDRAATSERALWNRYLPVVLGIAAIGLALLGWRGLRRLRRTPTNPPDGGSPPATSPPPPDTSRSTINAV